MNPVRLGFIRREAPACAYLSAVPHWLYFTPLRKHQPVWIRFATYSAMVGVGVAIVGLIVGVWMYSPPMKYRYKMTSLILAWRAIGKKLRLIVGVRQQMPRREERAAAAHPKG